VPIWPINIKQLVVAQKIWALLRKVIIRVPLAYCDITWLKLSLKSRFCRSDEIKVVFVVADISIWEVFSPLYRRLISDSRFAVSVIAIERVDLASTKPRSQVHRFFVHRSIKYSYLGKSQQSNFLWKSYDFAFFTLGTGAFPKQLSIQAASRHCRTIYLAYGMLLSNHHNYQYNHDSQHFAWRILAANDFEYSNYRLHARRANVRVVRTGYTKFEELSNMTNSSITGIRPTVIWAPHWTIGYRSHNRFGMFDQIRNEVITLIRSHPEIDFVLLPHPNLPDEFNQIYLTAGQSYEDYAEKFGLEKNAHVASVDKVAELFVRSSAMVTDSISFLGDYLFVQKPLLFLNRSDRCRLNDIGEQIIQCHYSGRNADDIDIFLKQVVIRQIDLNQNCRLHFRDLLWNSNHELPSKIVQTLLAREFKDWRQINYDS